MKGWVGVLAPHDHHVPVLDRERHERPLGVRPLTLRVRHVRVHVFLQPGRPLRHRCRTSVRLVSDVLLLLLLAEVEEMEVVVVVVAVSGASAGARPRTVAGRG